MLPLVNRMTKAVSGWLAPAYGGGIVLKADLDQVDGLSAEREALWARLNAATFLTVNEKRAAVGYAPVGCSSAGEAGVKYSPDQPRVPAGNEDGGQWTDGGGGGGSSSSDTGSEGPGRIHVAQAEGSEFSPSRRGWHDYAVTNQACPAELNCSKEEMADQLSRFAVPGQDPARPAKDRDTNLAVDPNTDLPGGFVETYVSEDGLTVTNRTLPLHLFFDGAIERRATQNRDGSWTITTRGFGNNVVPGMNVINEELGPGIFNELDRQLRENIERHNGVRKSIANIVGRRSLPAGAGRGHGSASHGE